jgi:hypothetical protein
MEVTYCYGKSMFVLLVKGCCRKSPVGVKVMVAMEISNCYGSEWLPWKFPRCYGESIVGIEICL